LVFEEQPQLVEGPAVVPVALGLPDADALTDARQVFHADALTGATRLLHEAAADLVVHVGLKASLFATKAFQDALGASRPFGLKRTPGGVVAVAHALDVGAAERLPF